MLYLSEEKQGENGFCPLSDVCLETDHQLTVCMCLKDTHSSLDMLHENENTFLFNVIIKEKLRRQVGRTEEQKQ